MSTTTFLEDPRSERFFAKLDYMLREGVHVQRNDEQEDYFDFIVAHESSLREYYSKFLKLYLEHGGEMSDRYYYLEFNNGDRGPVDERHRHSLKQEYVIVGLLLYKLLFNDGHFELNSVRKFQELLRLNYETLRVNINRLLAKLRADNNSETGDNRIDEVIASAMKEFEKLGWVLFYDDDSFEPQPSFQRLSKLYADTIHNLDEIMKNQSEQ